MMSILLELQSTFDSLLTLLTLQAFPNMLYSKHTRSGGEAVPSCLNQTLPPHFLEPSTDPSRRLTQTCCTASTRGWGRCRAATSSTSTTAASPSGASHRSRSRCGAGRFSLDVRLSTGVLEYRTQADCHRLLGLNEASLKNTVLSQCHDILSVMIYYFSTPVQECGAAKGQRSSCGVALNPKP